MNILELKYNTCLCACANQECLC